MTATGSASCLVPPRKPKKNAVSIYIVLEHSRLLQPSRHQVVLTMTPRFELSASRNMLAPTCLMAGAEMHETIHR